MCGVGKVINTSSKLQLGTNIIIITYPLYQFKTMVVAQCATTDGPTDAPNTTVAPCNDKWSNCAALAEEKCYKGWVGEECPKSCGKCPGDKIDWKLMKL